MRPLSELLTVLIATSEDIIRRPRAVPTQLPQSFHELAHEIRQHDKQSVEGKRCTSAAIIMLLAIEEFMAGPHDTTPWHMMVGATLPLLRVDAWNAMNAEREARR
jgi:hypothetical protein